MLTCNIRNLLCIRQVATQRSWKRPFGVGLLVAGHDQSGAKLFYNCPSGNFYEYKAFAIGARSQVLRQTSAARCHSRVWTCCVRIARTVSQPALWQLVLTVVLMGMYNVSACA
jgi:hypothetical protein